MAGEKKPKKIIAHFYIRKQCRSYGLPLWQCPQFLFLIMGIIIMGAALSFFAIGSSYIDDPLVVAFIVLLITGVLLVLAGVITRSFDYLAEIARMKSEFINIVSHQLRAPLTNLRWALEFLMAKDWEGGVEKKEEYYSTVKENVNRIGELIDDLLVVGGLEKGVAPFKRKDVSLENMIKELITRFKAFAEASNIEITFQSQGNVPLLFVDPSHMKLVVENLIDNAVRYTRGGGRIDIKIARQDEKVYFEIKDTGVGIPQKDQKYIFQKFFRSENALKEQIKGSGLGLYIVKSIVEEEGGEINFKSEEGKGTTFFFTLPVK